MKTALAERADPDTAEDLAADLADFASGLDQRRLPETVRATVRVNVVVPAQFGIPFTVAAAWIDGAVGLRLPTEDGLQRADILAPAKLSIRIRDASLVAARVAYSKGHPEHPTTPAASIGKLEDCATFSARPFGPEHIRALTQAVDGLDSAPDLAALTGALA